MSTSEVIPYGEWPSPISATTAAVSGTRLAFPQLVGSDLWWTAGRPAEGGRQVVLRRAADGTVSEVLPAGWNARTRVHEYGGLSYAVADGVLVFSEFTDQRLYSLADGATDPQPLTPEPEQVAALRYADLLVVGDEVWCVRETHTDGPVARHLVAVPLDGSQDASSREAPTSLPTLGSRPTAPTWPGSRGTTPRCRGTAPSCASRR